MPTIVVYSSELYHHGIKGQKWGIRRYQNEDGTLTPEGKARYGVETTTFNLNKKNWNTPEGKAWRKRVRKGLLGKFREGRLETEIKYNGRNVDLNLDRRDFNRTNRKDMNFLARYSGWETGRAGGKFARSKNRTYIRINGKNEQDAKKMRAAATAAGAVLLAANIYRKVDRINRFNENMRDSGLDPSAKAWAGSAKAVYDIADRTFKNRQKARKEDKKWAKYDKQMEKEKKYAETHDILDSEYQADTRSYETESDRKRVRGYLNGPS